jgi:hypothetical protein
MYFFRLSRRFGFRCQGTEVMRGERDAKVVPKPQKSVTPPIRRGPPRGGCSEYITEDTTRTNTLLFITTLEGSGIGKGN